jgi:hypothetical protein
MKRPHNEHGRWRARSWDLPALLLRRHLWLCIALFLQAAPSCAAGPGKFFKRVLDPFRSNPFLMRSAQPCGLGFATCFMPSEAEAPQPSAFEPDPHIEDPDRKVSMQLRTLHSGPMCHHWLEVETSRGKVTLGYGPATVPFIDAGQISLHDTYGNIERFSGMHPVPMMGLPPVNYSYAKAPGYGHVIGKEIPMTLAQADALVQKERHHKFVGPYVPFFHDCRTYVCTVQASARGRSSLPCYLLFKGYW